MQEMSRKIRINSRMSVAHTSRYDFVGLVAAYPLCMPCLVWVHKRSLRVLSDAPRFVVVTAPYAVIKYRFRSEML